MRRFFAVLVLVFIGLSVHANSVWASTAHVSVDVVTTEPPVEVSSITIERDVESPALLNTGSNTAELAFGASSLLLVGLVVLVFSRKKLRT